MRRFAFVCNRHAVVSAALLLTCLIGPAALAADAGSYALVHVELDSPAVEASLRANTGLDVVQYKPGSHVEIVARPRDLAWLDGAGVRYRTIHADLTAHYAAKSRGPNFGLFHTYSEATDWLDVMHADHPDVVSAKWSIGTTHEGRDIWCVRVSDNPETDETGEPEILFDGMHHAREIMSSETVLMLIDLLGASYGVDPEITWLLDNREIYLVPIVNPDGVVYNEAIAPDGGGMWRKNRRDNGDGSYGVDPNRNYPYQWGGEGSSDDTFDDLYRGPSPASEPEVQAIMALVDAHEFVTHQTNHTYSNFTLYPWGYTDGDSPHEATYVYMGDIMTQYNGYAPGQPSDLLWYGVVSGGTFDWVYGDTTGHPLCYAFSNEIGGSSDGFWPDESRREALFNENVWPSLYLIMCAGPYVRSDAPVVVGGDGNGRLDAGETAGLAFDLDNMAVDADATNVTIALSTDDPYLLPHETSRALGTVAARGSADIAAAPFSATLDAACPDGRAVVVNATIAWDGGLIEQDLIYPAGAAQILFADDFEGPMTAWTTTGQWDLTSGMSHSPSTSLTDSPGLDQDYGDEETTSATLTDGVPVPAAGVLTFWHRYDIEDDYDYGYVQVSGDGGPFTTVGTYTGLQSTWTQVEIDLAAYNGQAVRVRFELVTDYSVHEDGWYVDDVVIEGVGSSNALPPAPALIDPAPGAETPTTATLSCGTVTDPEGDTVTYGFRVYDDAALTSVVFATDGIAAVDDQAQVDVAGLTDGATYWWRAFGADETEWGLMGEARAFTVNAATAVDGVILGFDLRQLDRTGGESVRLSLNLPRAGDLAVTVYNARGQAVRTLASGERSAGAHVLTWDGRDAAGRAAASGVYFVKARSGAETAVSRVLMVR